MPENDLSVRWRCLFNSPFMHPAVMIRADTLTRNKLSYNEDFSVAQDYELWSHLLAFGKGANLPERLYIRRDRRISISRQRQAEQHRIRDIVSRRLLEEQFPGQMIDMDVMGKLRTIFINREDSPVLPTAPDIDEYQKLLANFSAMNREHVDFHRFHRRELLGQAAFFLRHRQLSIAFPFIREFYRILVAGIA